MFCCSNARLKYHKNIHEMIENARGGTTDIMHPLLKQLDYELLSRKLTDLSY